LVEVSICCGVVVVLVMGCRVGVVVVVGGEEVA
jgi:hypothetical protein